MSPLADKKSDRALAAPNAADHKLPKILVVDDDESVRKMLHVRLSDSYEIIETGEPERAVALALEHKPEAILMDLMMPGFSGFELCSSLRALSYTSRIPIFVVSGESGTKYRDYCANLGARGYFQKPIEFMALKTALAAEISAKLPERRKQKRLQMRVLLKLRGTDADGKPFEVATATDNVSAGGFLAVCTAPLMKGATVEVFLVAGGEKLVTPVALKLYERSRAGRRGRGMDSNSSKRLLTGSLKINRTRRICPRARFIPFNHMSTGGTVDIRFAELKAWYTRLEHALEHKTASHPLLDLANTLISDVERKVAPEPALLIVEKLLQEAQRAVDKYGSNIRVNGKQTNQAITYPL